MDLTYKQEVGVGALVLAGLTLFVVGLFWFSGRSIRHKGVYAHVAFTNVAGLKEGDPVLVSGVKVGRVSKVSLERVGRVSVTLELSGEERPRTDASATISSLDFFGAKFVDYIPGSKDEFLPTTSVIVGTKSQELTDIASGVATRANELLGNATGLVSDQLSTDIHNTLIATQRGMVALTEVTKGPLVTQSTNSLAALERVMSRLDTLLGAANVKGAGLRLDTLSANLQHLTGELSQSTRALNDLLGKVNRGEGTLGKLASDTLLYGNLNKTLAALTKLLDDLRERPGRYLTV
ncbi:MAG TPA: MlaD family protein, partial [Gemmatimonadales bacterium]|nr:MlaD family protein [Gemmatimonadales bacterium]